MGLARQIGKGMLVNCDHHHHFGFSETLRIVTSAASLYQYVTGQMTSLDAGKL
jgi:hypothetical protein